MIMGKLQEVEVKYPLLNQSKVLSVLKTLGAEKKVDNQYQLDIYFTPSHKDFLDNEIVSEWLRIRKTEKKNTVNFKRWLPVGAKIQTHCDEFEVNINDVETMEMIFKSLDFQEIIRVEKTRNSWVLNGIEISIDAVEGLGCFIELEAIDKVEEKDIPLVHEKFKNLLGLLNAETGEQDRRGYPYLIIEMKKGSNNNVP